MPVFGCHDKFQNAEFQDLVRKRNSERENGNWGEATNKK